MSEKKWRTDPDTLQTRWIDGLKLTYPEASRLWDTNPKEMASQAAQHMMDTYYSSHSSAENTLTNRYPHILNEITAAAKDLPGAEEHPASQAMEKVFLSNQSVTEEDFKPWAANRDEAITQLLDAHRQLSQSSSPDGPDPRDASAADETADSAATGTATAATASSAPNFTSNIKPQTKWQKAFEEMGE